MTDIFDRASALEEQQRNAALLEHQQRNQVLLLADSAMECDDCGKPIAQARRLAVVGCRCCVQCQEQRECHAKTGFIAYRD